MLRAVRFVNLEPQPIPGTCAPRCVPLSRLDLMKWFQYRYAGALPHCTLPVVPHRLSARPLDEPTPS